MFPKVIKAAAGPHDFDPENNYDEIVPELAVQLSSDSDTGSDVSGDSTTDYSSSVTSYESELEVFHNASSVCRFSFPWLPNLTSLFRRKKILSMSSQNMSSKSVLLVGTC